jgi:hypothetical protein
MPSGFDPRRMSVFPKDRAASNIQHGVNGIGLKRWTPRISMSHVPKTKRLLSAQL